MKNKIPFILFSFVVILLFTFYVFAQTTPPVPTVPAKSQFENLLDAFVKASPLIVTFLGAIVLIVKQVKSIIEKELKGWSIPVTIISCEVSDDKKCCKKLPVVDSPNNGYGPVSNGILQNIKPKEST